MIRPIAGVMPQRQKGAVFFVSLMLLIILSLLAVSAAQVTSLQERMANIYRADLTAFENAEARLRRTEATLLDDVDLCSKLDPYAVTDWQANPAGTAATATIVNIAKGPNARGFALRGSSQVGLALTGGDVNCTFFTIAVIDHDTPNTPGAPRTSTSIVQANFVP